MKIKKATAAFLTVVMAAVLFSNSTAQASESSSVVPASPHISEYGRQAAEEFLSQMTTIFDPVGWAETTWVNGTEVRTGRYVLGWDRETRESITTNARPNVIHRWDNSGFFDANGDRIISAPWLNVKHYSSGHGDWTSYFYADYFKLFNFDNSGIPVIFVHFSQTFEGGYGGFYEIFRYVDGEYRRLEMRAFGYGMELLYARLASFHDFFIDNSGRIIVHSNNEYGDHLRYEHLVLTDVYADLHLIADAGTNWQAWENHHWNVFNHDWELTDSWKYHNPTIFGTNIPIALIEPLIGLQDQITVSITQRLRAEGRIR